MKKFRLLCLLLCLILMLQGTLVPAYASEVPEETTESAESSDPTETTGENVRSEVFVIPDNVTGDASVSHGCHGIDAQKPLAYGQNLTKTAKGALLYEMNTDTLVYAKNPDEKLYPASLTKVMTCLIALERGNLTDMVTVSESAISNLDPDGTSAYLQAGEEISLGDLLYCLMVESANDAAAVVAEYIAGSQAAFVNLMNQKAAQIGCTGTNFANPHGLHHENHYTTARDMAKILMAALEYEDFNQIYSTSHYTVPATNMSDARELYTTVNLIRTEDMDWYYDERYIGGKTGFTTPAGRCLVTVSESEDGAFKMLSVILGAEATIHADGYTILEFGHFEETEEMVDHTCYNYTILDVYARGQTMDLFQVSGGENSVAAEPDQNKSVMVPDDYKDAEINLLTEGIPGGLEAPVNVGDKVGTLRVWYRDVCVSQTDLLSMSVSKKDTMTSIFSGGVLTEEEDQKITGTFHVIARWFVIVVAVVAGLALIVAVYNGITEFQRRKRRRNRSRNRRRSR